MFEAQQQLETASASWLGAHGDSIPARLARFEDRVADLRDRIATAPRALGSSAEMEELAQMEAALRLERALTDLKNERANTPDPSNLPI